MIQKPILVTLCALAAELQRLYENRTVAVNGGAMLLLA